MIIKDNKQRYSTARVLIELNSSGNLKFKEEPVFYKILVETFFFTLPYSVWSSIVIVHEKGVFFLLLFFRNISKTAEAILINKNWAKPWHFGLQKSSNK